METLKEDIKQELNRIRIDKKHIYNTLLKIIDAIPQEELPLVEIETITTPDSVEPETVHVSDEPEPTPVTMAEVPVEPEVSSTPTAKKTSVRKNKVTMKV